MFECACWSSCRWNLIYGKDFMKLKNKNVLVYGLGDSGRAVIKLLKKLGAHISFFDDDVRYFDWIGFVRNPLETKWDLCVVSPGIKCLGNEILKGLQQNKVPIISELDFAYLHSKGKIVAITGTNGKTTVSMLVHRILKMAGMETFLCGNIGLPFSSVCQQTTDESVTVCEVSNFQLETSKFFRADVSCILNVLPDHLDRHGSFEEYLRVKGLIAQNLTRKDVLILNLDDENAKKMILHKKFSYFSKNKLKKGVYVWQNAVHVGKKSVLDLSDIPLLGEKNLENVLASVAICSQFKVPTNVFRDAISTFVPANHRMQIVGEIDGVTYVDDSKATNVASTVACVQAFKEKSFFLLMGGQGKDIDYAELFSKKYFIKKVVCFGQEGKKIEQCAQGFGYETCAFEKFDEAVLFCMKNATKSDFVLLSPSCASFDEFSSYAERGERFSNLVLGNLDE